MFGVEDPSREPIADTISDYAARTLYQASPVALPPQFPQYVAAVLANAASGNGSH